MLPAGVLGCTPLEPVTSCVFFYLLSHFFEICLQHTTLLLSFMKDTGCLFRWRVWAKLTLPQLHSLAAKLHAM
jgi:hypothetical protein